MFTSWIRPRRKILLYGLPLLALIFAANHLEYHWRCARLQRRLAQSHAVSVRMEGSFSGHTMIGVDESTVASNGEVPFLRFALLGSWPYDRESRVPCPDAVRALDGKESECVGFMYPLEAGQSIHTFCLLRTTQTCCYGPRPQYSQYLLVEMKQPVKFERFSPVLVKGKFFVDPQPDQGFIYRMEGTSAAAMGEDEPDLNAADVARQAKLPLFRFSALQGMANKSLVSSSLPPDLLALNGRQVVLEGFVSQRTEGTPPHLLLSAKWWDGLSQSKSPGIYGGLIVVLRDKGQLPPAWKQKAVLTGTLEVQQDPSVWPRDGIVMVHDAVLGGPNGVGAHVVTDPGPFLEPIHEAMLTIVFLYFVWRRGKHHSGSESSV